MVSVLPSPVFRLSDSMAVTARGVRFTVTRVRPLSSSASNIGPPLPHRRRLEGTDRRLGLQHRVQVVRALVVVVLPDGRDRVLGGRLERAAPAGDRCHLRPSTAARAHANVAMMTQPQNEKM